MRRWLAVSFPLAASLMREISASPIRRTIAISPFFLAPLLPTERLFPPCYARSERLLGSPTAVRRSSFSTFPVDSPPIVVTLARKISRQLDGHHGHGRRGREGLPFSPRFPLARGASARATSVCRRPPCRAATASRGPRRCRFCSCRRRHSPRRRSGAVGRPPCRRRSPLGCPASSRRRAPSWEFVVGERGEGARRASECGRRTEKPAEPATWTA